MRVIDIMGIVGTYMLVFAAGMLFVIYHSAKSKYKK